MKYVIKYSAYNEIETFYTNMWKKYRHTWGKDEVHRLIDKCFNAMFQIEKTLKRRSPILKRWTGLYMAQFKLNSRSSWYFAYKIDTNNEEQIIYVEDACHSQNIHEKIEDKFDKLLLEWFLEYYQQWYNYLYH